MSAEVAAKRSADERYVEAMKGLEIGAPVDLFEFDEVIGERLSDAADSVANAVLALHSERSLPARLARVQR